MSKRVTGSAVDPKNTATSKAKFIEEFRKKDEEIEKLKKALEGAKKGHEKQLADNKALKAEVTKLKAELAKAQKAEADSKKAEADAKKAEADSKKAETQAQADLKKVQLENADLKNKLDAAEKKAKAGGASSELDVANGKVGTHTEYGFAVDVPGVGKKVISIDDDKVKTIVDSYGPDAGKNSWWWVKKDGTVDETEGNNGVPTLGQLVNLGKF
ncbi:hypothetical protein IKD57_02560 [Candidatus Saccharibacteria bacterium]|nr:hypothetical protein [Candidatus Saccharibacteria bacterium]